MITLPSNGLIPSGIDHVEMRKLNIADLKIISASIKADDYSLFIEAIDNTIDADINQLAIRDFYKLVTIHRLRSYPSTPVEFGWDCNGVVMHTAAGQLVTPEEAQELDDDINLSVSTCGAPNKAKFSNIEDFGEEVLDIEIPDFAQVPLVKNLAEMRELMKNPTLYNVAPIAAWLKEGDTITDKIELIGENLDLFDKLAQLNQNSFGVRSLLIAECSSCSKKVSARIHIDNNSFFR